ARNLVSAGNSIGDFGPETKVSRAAFAHMFAQLERANLNQYSTSAFTDVSPASWYFAAVEWAAETGIILGVGDGRFEPDRLVTREEMATMLDRYIDYKGWDKLVPATRDMPFVDYDQISEWASPSVTVIQQLGIIEGRPGRIYDPKGIATRAEYATIFTRLIKIFS
ncbi:MAG: S-layer homology domain-containing protein, partial [Oscillospiraceae bacterium]|nr:S-layer homology domain-containing protein [Oscillospiraceae bacterium]